MKEETFPPTSIKLPVEIWRKYHEDLTILLGVYRVPVESKELVDDDLSYAFDLPAGWTKRLDDELRKFLDEFLQ